MVSDEQIAELSADTSTPNSETFSSSEISQGERVVLTEGNELVELMEFPSLVLPATLGVIGGGILIARAVAKSDNTGTSVEEKPTAASNNAGTSVEEKPTAASNNAGTSVEEKPTAASNNAGTSVEEKPTAASNTAGTSVEEKPTAASNNAGTSVEEKPTAASNTAGTSVEEKPTAASNNAGTSVEEKPTAASNNAGTSVEEKPTAASNNAGTSVEEKPTAASNNAGTSVEEKPTTASNNAGTSVEEKPTVASNNAGTSVEEKPTAASNNAGTSVEEKPTAASNNAGTSVEEKPTAASNNAGTSVEEKPTAASNNAGTSVEEKPTTASNNAGTSVEEKPTVASNNAGTSVEEKPTATSNNAGISAEDDNKAPMPSREITKDENGNTVTTDYFDEDNDGFIEKSISIVRNDELQAISATIEFKERDGSSRRVGKIDTDNDGDSDTSFEILVNSQGETTQITHEVDHHINNIVECHSIQIGNKKETTVFFENEYHDISSVFTSEILPDGREKILFGSNSGGGIWSNIYDDQGNHIATNSTLGIWYPAGYKGPREDVFKDEHPMIFVSFSKDPEDVQFIDSDGNGSLDTKITSKSSRNGLIYKNTFVDLDGDGKYEKTIEQDFDNLRLRNRDYTLVTTTTKEYLTAQAEPSILTVEVEDGLKNEYSKKVEYQNGVNLKQITKEGITKTTITHPNGDKYETEDRNSDGIPELILRTIKNADGSLIHTVQEKTKDGLIHKEIVSTLNADNQMLTHRHTEYDYENGLVYYHTWEDTNGDGVISMEQGKAFANTHGLVYNYIVEAENGEKIDTSNQHDKSTAQVSLLNTENILSDGGNLHTVKLEIENADGSRRIVEYIDSDNNGQFDTTKTSDFDIKGMLVESEIVIDNSQDGSIDKWIRYYQSEQGNYLHIEQYRGFEQIDPVNFNNTAISLTLSDTNRDGYFETLDATNPIAGKLLNLNEELFEHSYIDVQLLEKLHTVNILKSYGDVSLTIDHESLNISKLNARISVDFPNEQQGNLTYKIATDDYVSNIEANSFQDEEYIYDNTVHFLIA